MVANVFNLTVFLFVSIFSSSFLPFTSKIWSRTENLISYKLFVFPQFFLIHFFLYIVILLFFPHSLFSPLIYLRVCLSVCHLSVSMFVFLSSFGGYWKIHEAGKIVFFKSISFLLMQFHLEFLFFPLYPFAVFN